MSKLERFGIYKGQQNYHEEIIYSLALLYNIINMEMTAYLKEFELSPGKLNILIAIRHHGGKRGLPQVEISKHLIVTPSNMTKMIDKLEADHFVKRESLEGDRRVNIIKITRKGAELLDKIWPEYNKKLIGLVGTLETSKQKKLAQLLTGWFEKVV